MPFFGVHMSIAGGLYKAFERGRRVQAQALQIFTRNQRQWALPRLSDEEVAAFMAAGEEWGNQPLAAHGSYLINLANPERETAARFKNYPMVLETPKGEDLREDKQNLHLLRSMIGKS